ncbi:MAG: succinate dehydrogenase cytochrome b subunit [Bacteroides sp.]|nr:succinate dehydrogenase cytochrome b subunit [Bacteroides sp.]
MWLTSSSVGRKLVMAITGACLVLFVTFHALMNGVALFWPSAYNAVCAFLGANWYALIASIGLAALFIIHIIYAVWLTIQNRKARGNDRYAVYCKPKQVEWSSQNMLVLGIVIIAFLVIHLIQFWAKMQWAEICHDPVHVDGVMIAPQSGTLFLQLAFSQVFTPIVYIIGFIALWFHMTHGFWSMFQSAGWDNDTWLPRLKTISCWWTTIVVGLFIAQAIVFTVQAHRGAYLTDPQLIEQYQEFNAHMVAGFEQPSYPGVDCQNSDCNDCVSNDAACNQGACDQACVEVVEVVEEQ